MSGEGISNPLDETELLANIAVIQADVDLLQVDVDAIREVTDAEPVLEETGGTLTTDGTEQNVYINNAPAGIYNLLWLNINFSNQTVTETVVIRTYYRNVSGGAWVGDDSDTIAAIPSDLLIWIALKPTRFGVRVTIEKTAGTNRAYVWEVFYEVL